VKDTVRLGRIMGVPVGLNWSLLVIVAVFAYGLARDRLPYDAPGYGRPSYAVAGLVTAVALLVSVLLHEFGHAIVARRFGLNVEGITLSWMGGVTRITGEASTPGRELGVAGVGPAVSLILGGALWAGRELAVHAGAGNLAAAALGWLAVINVVLAAFNLIPAAPLDGGKVLHAAVWSVTHNRWLATKVAARAGILLAGAVLALGLFEVLARGDELDGLFVLVLGWWLLSAARDEEQLAMVHHVLGGVPVHDVMRPVGSAPGWVGTEEFVDRYARSRPGWVWLLERWGGGYTGVISGDALTSGPLPVGDSRAADLAVPIDAASPAAPGEEVLDALERTGGRRVLLVVEAERTVGAVLPGDIEAILRSRHRPAAGLYSTLGFR
jgi:Zn-dependent protease